MGELSYSHPCFLFLCVLVTYSLFFYLPLAFSLFLRFLLFSSVVFELIFTV